MNATPTHVSMVLFVLMELMDIHVSAQLVILESTVKQVSFLPSYSLDLIWVANFLQYGKHRNITEIEYKQKTQKIACGKQNFCDSTTTKKDIQENHCF